MSGIIKQLTTPNPKNFLLEGSNQIYENYNYDDPHSYNIITPGDFHYMEQINNVRLIMPWVIFTIGLIGNSLILIIFLRRSALRYFNSNAFCFCALAISDLCALIFMVCRSLLTSQLIGNVAASCKIIKYIYYSSLQISAWCLVLLTIDRLIAVMFIFKYMNWSKKWHSIKLLIAFIISILLINLHILIFVTADTLNRRQNSSGGIQNQLNLFYPNNLYPSSLLNQNQPTRQPKQTKYVCQVDSNRFPTYYRYIYSKWDIYHAVIYGALPFVIILISNILIIYKLKFFRNRKINKSPVQTSDDYDENKIEETKNVLNNNNDNFNNISDNNVSNENENSKSISSSTESLKKFRSYQINIMLISIAFIFILLVSPISIYMAIIYENIKDTVSYAKREYVKVILRYICYFNNAINFYVYLIFSSQFRKNFFNLFGCQLKLKKNNTHHIDNDKNNKINKINNDQAENKLDYNYEAGSAIKELGILANLSSNIENINKNHNDYDDDNDNNDTIDYQHEPNYTKVTKASYESEKPIPSPRYKKYQLIPTEDDSFDQNSFSSNNERFVENLVLNEDNDNKNNLRINDGEQNLIKEALLNGDLRYYPRSKQKLHQINNESFKPNLTKLYYNGFNYKENNNNNNNSDKSSFRQHQDNKFYRQNSNRNKLENFENNSQVSTLIDSKNSSVSVFEFPNSNDKSQISSFKKNDSQQITKPYISPKPSIV